MKSRRGLDAGQCGVQFLSKIWLIPFRLSSGDGSGGSSEGSDGGISENLVFSWLFSGISAGLSFYM
ncbi:MULTISPECIES: hypothetical protein [Treponema]|uniref:hypothetical protein n=1 Tax=Treponema TaxID=157 RepID=UPI00235355AB|nr:MULTISPECIES: hypothetical protein [Treponema]MCI6180267.1 hypothetical protein [Treponema porcinum]MCI6815566.1 hypothetical protein [Treponema porcinum]